MLWTLAPSVLLNRKRMDLGTLCVAQLREEDDFHA